MFRRISTVSLSWGLITSLPLLATVVWIFGVLDFLTIVFHKAILSTGRGWNSDRVRKNAGGGLVFHDSTIFFFPLLSLDTERLSAREKDFEADLPRFEDFGLTFLNVLSLELTSIYVCGGWAVMLALLIEMVESLIILEAMKSSEFLHDGL